MIGDGTFLGRYPDTFLVSIDIILSSQCIYISKDITKQQAIF